MKGDFCRMCGGTELRHEKRDVVLESRKKTVKNIAIWVCENCGEEFLDDASSPKLYNAARSRKTKRTVPA